jgi:endonuclease YncB( thermonuclease family)
MPLDSAAHHESPVTNHQSPGPRSPVTGHGSPTRSQSPITNHQSLVWWSLITALIGALLTGPAGASTLAGRIVAVADGDTLTILTDDHKQHRIRVAGIDAPEKRQAFGTRSRENLARMAHGKAAVADCPKTDRYGRKVCKVFVQPADCPQCGKTLDVGYAQISAGLAWWYRRYAKEQSIEDRGRYESEETDARLRKRGLWSDPAAVAPWDWRQKSRTARAPDAR